MYRSLPTRLENAANLLTPHCGIRPPGNVPYLVDNLWEWKRPNNIPSRRKAMFASPTKELALAVPGNMFVYKININPSMRIFQLTNYEDNFSPEDAKYHPDCKRLPRLLINILGQDWIRNTVSEKLEVGRLYIPCLQKNEMDDIFSKGPLKHKKEDIEAAITYWKYLVEIKENTLADPKGELMVFTSEPYTLTEC